MVNEDYQKRIKHNSEHGNGTDSLVSSTERISSFKGIRCILVTVGEHANSRAVNDSLLQRAGRCLYVDSRPVAKRH